MAGGAGARAALAAGDRGGLVAAGRCRSRCTSTCTIRCSRDGTRGRGRGRPGCHGPTRRRGPTWASCWRTRGSRTTRRRTPGRCASAGSSGSGRSNGWACGCATPWTRVLDEGRGPEHPRWLVGARFNLVESCLAGDPARPAIVSGGPDGSTQHRDRGRAGARGGADRRGPAGGGVHRRRRHRHRHADGRAGRSPSTWASWPRAWWWSPSPTPSPPRRWPPACASPAPPASSPSGRSSAPASGCPSTPSCWPIDPPRAIVVDANASELRSGDQAWPSFLAGGASADLDPVVGEADTVTNILFSSGTTGEPKAIPWTQLQPLKSAVDAALHLDVQPGDVVAWPTNLGLDDGALAHLRQPAQPGHHGPLRRRPHRPGLRRVRRPGAGRRARPGPLDREGLAQRRPHGGPRFLGHQVLRLDRRGLEPRRLPLSDDAGGLPAGHRILRRHRDRRRLPHGHARAARLARHLLHARPRLGPGPARRGGAAGRQRRGLPGAAHPGLLARACSTATTTRSTSPARRPARAASCCAATAIRSSGWGAATSGRSAGSTTR